MGLAIIRMRPFEKLEDLLKVPGIKEKRLELMRPYVTLNKAL
jgi:DNA uptake protein ComE-like DNA-binding protein